jgi:hypothetical protein
LRRLEALVDADHERAKPPSSTNLTPESLAAAFAKS